MEFLRITGLRSVRLALATCWRLLHFAKDKWPYIALKRFLVPVPEISAVYHDPL
jgi:hypothetical protein